MKTLIIGGNRFFGRKLAELLIQGGHSVTLLNRGGLDDGLRLKVDRITCDRTDEEKMQQLLRDKTYDVVYDQVCFDAHQASAAMRIFKDKTPRYIFTSSMSVYPSGLNLSEFVFDPFNYQFETVATFPPDYAEAKRQAEARFFQEGKMEIAAVRFPIVMGEDDYTQRLKFHVDRIKKHLEIYFPNLEAKLSCINSDDAASALLKLGYSSFTGPVNIASPQPIQLSELVTLIERTTGEKAFLADAADDKNASPFGIPSDWSMDTSLAEQNNIVCAPVNSWLPKLVKVLAT